MYQRFPAEYLWDRLEPLRRSRARPQRATVWYWAQMGARGRISILYPYKSQLQKRQGSNKNQIRAPSTWWPSVFFWRAPKGRPTRTSEAIATVPEGGAFVSHRFCLFHGTDKTRCIKGFPQNVCVPSEIVGGREQNVQLCVAGHKWAHELKHRFRL
jgi:hypothetical protein